MVVTHQIIQSTAKKWPMHQIYQDWHIALTDIDDQDKISICSRHKNIAIISDTTMCISSSPEIIKIMKVNTLKNTAKGREARIEFMSPKSVTNWNSVLHKVAHRGAGAGHGILIYQQFNRQRYILSHWYHIECLWWFKIMMPINVNCEN